MSKALLTPVPDTPHELALRLRTFLSQRGVSSMRRISIEVQDGTVMLRGTVSSFYERQLCLACTRHIPGVILIAPAWDMTNSLPGVPPTFDSRHSLLGVAGDLGKPRAMS